MGASFEEMLAYVERLKPLEAGPDQDVKKAFPDLTMDDTYRLQFAFMKKLVAAGDSVVGYKASAVRGNAAKQRPGVPVPSIGTLLRSQLRGDGDTVPVEALEGTDFVEPEVLVLLKRDLAGPGVTPMDVLAATEAFFPSIEIAPMPPGFRELKWSHNHIIVDMKRTGTVIVGHQGISPHGVDLRLEGVVGRLDGEVQGSATACTVMGSPLNVVAAIANDLARFEMGLKTGQIIQTGSIIEPMQAKKGQSREALVEFTRIGSVRVRFAQ